MSLRSIALTAAACVAATMTAATQASAADISVSPDTVTVRVSYADLNLANPAGRARLERRIAGAARGMCGHYFPTELRMFSLVSACRAEAISSARIPAVADSGGARGGPGQGMSRAAS